MDPVQRLLLDPEPLTPALLGLATQGDLEVRLSQYLTIAGVPAGTEPTEPQRQRALALVYGARIVVLEGEAEKFRREGKITIERDLQSRIARLSASRDAALLAATPAAESAATADLAPYMTGWCDP